MALRLWSRSNGNSPTQYMDRRTYDGGVIYNSTHSPRSDLAGDEVVEIVKSSRSNNNLQNAANRSRVNNFDQLLPGWIDNREDSIIGDTMTEDIVDGDLRTKRIDMSFSLLDAASLVFSMSSFFLDLVTDVAVATFHYLNEDLWYCALTLAFIILPTLITTMISLRWYIVDSRVEGSQPISKSKWTVRLIFHILQIGPVIRYYESLQYGLKFRETQDLSEKKEIYMKMIYEDADATMLRLFESFMESAPQLMLQVYIISRNYPFDDYEYWTAIVQVMSISSSLISISWSLVSYAKSLRISLTNKVPMTYWSIAVMFSWEFFSITARMIALALFTSAFVRQVGFVCLSHWALMTLWIYSMKTSFCNTKWEEIGFNAVLGVIFIFCYFNPIDTPTRYRYILFYTFMLIENSTFMYLWTRSSNYEPWIKNMAVQAHYSCFCLGIILMLIYYKFFHPTGGIKLRKSHSLDVCHQQVEDNRRDIQ